MLNRISIVVLLTVLMLLLGPVSSSVTPVAAVEPRVLPQRGAWSHAFAEPHKLDPGYMPIRPIEWNGTLYAGIVGIHGFAPGVGYWSGQQWLKLDGLSGEVDSVVVHQQRLYAAGRLTLGNTAINLAFWDGTRWTAVPTHVRPNVFVLASHDDDLYVGGYSAQIHGQPSGLLMRWDGNQWHPVAEGIYGAVLSILSRPDGLYLGGTFQFNGSRTGLLHWNGTTWHTVGGGVQGMVMDLEWANDQLYISGQFTSTLEPRMQNIAAWNGTSWNTFGVGIVSPTQSLVMHDGALYALSKTSNDPNTPVFQLQRWDTSQWTTLSQLHRPWFFINWLSYPDAVLVSYQQSLWAFGQIRFADSREQTVHSGDSALRWTGEQWESMTPNGIAATTLAFAVDGEDVYATSPSLYWGNGRTRLAHLSPENQWQALMPYDSAPSMLVAQALQKYQHTFFGIYDAQLYHTSGTTWTRVNLAEVKSLAQANNLLYVAGDFEQFNDVTAHNVVTWNGSHWHALNAPASFDRVVIVEADAQYVYISDGMQVARWDGTQWTTLATNVSTIRAVEPTAHGVYIAGTFSSVDDVSAPNIAYWNGSVWTGLPGVIDGSILDLEMGSDGLYVAGGFQGISAGIRSRGILRWDGVAWHGLGGGVNGPAHHPSGVAALAATPTRMLMYGSFDRVGTTYESSQIAAWDYGNEPLITATHDYGITYRPQPITVDVVANDWSDQPNLLQLVAVSSPSHGTAVVSGNAVRYTPNAQFEGIETMTYTVRDPINAVTSTAHLQVQVWNHFPQIADREYLVTPLTETVFDPVDGLIDRNGDALTITHARAISGTVMLVKNHLHYQPPTQTQFTDVVTYTVSDGHGGQQIAYLNLYSLASAVVAVDDDATTYRPHAVDVAVLANDSALHNEPLQLVAVSPASHGTATVNGRAVRYVPDADFQGIDTVHYTVRNQTRGITTTGTLTIDVQNHVPTVAPITITVHRNSTTMLDVVAHASDLNGDPLVIIQASASAGTVAVVTNHLRYTAPTTYPFADTISYTVSDGFGGFQKGTVVVTSTAYSLFIPYISK